MDPTRPFLLLAVVLALLCLGETRTHCNQGEMECGTGVQCVLLTNVCDGNYQCSDGSDESSDICSFWKTQTYRSYHQTRSGCLDSTMDKRFCQVFTSQKLEYQSPRGINLTDELVATLNDAVNSTLNKAHKCPMLYTLVGDKCFAFFSPAKLPWAEARQFCKSIYGDLAHFTESKTFGLVLDYMKEALLSSSYWLGGRYDLDTNAWAWVHDDSPMPLGSPYWTLIHSSTCKARPPPHTDPFSDPPTPLPGAPCYKYTQAPSQRAQGWCSAMTYEHFYYLTEDECAAAQSPLCMLNPTE